MKHLLIALAVALLSMAASAQSCEGGIYLNPQVIRGEGTPQVVGAANELAEFLGRTGLSSFPVLNVSGADEAMAALKRGQPPCWVYGNPVVGLASGYRPVAVNTEEIQSAVLLLADAGSEKDPKPVELSKLGADEQAKLRARLKASTCFGIRSGVTTALVKAEKLCGKVVEVIPQAGLGQSYLPTKAAFEWQSERWVGLITRVQGARNTTMKNHIGSDPKFHNARLVVVPTQKSSWGYGIYLRPEVTADVTKKVVAQFATLKQPSPSLARALDVGQSFKFASLAQSEVDAMRAALDMAP
ncbi:MAG: hypothetical protein HY854_18320 [Burkholderiales bacterium]|nr:hypothetical protein [Burkholderiales bacterium]